MVSNVAERALAKLAARSALVRGPLAPPADMAVGGLLLDGRSAPLLARGWPVASVYMDSINMVGLSRVDAEPAPCALGGNSPQRASWWATCRRWPRRYRRFLARPSQNQPRVIKHVGGATGPIMERDPAVRHSYMFAARFRDRRLRAFDTSMRQESDVPVPCGDSKARGRSRTCSRRPPSGSVGVLTWPRSSLGATQCTASWARTSCRLHMVKQ